ncbi:maleylpyruvate isomerase N-terminal domain-containing protein [Nocardioides sp. TRM66260-LWL]|uniref:maleylpyruvate isomerase N-terminal domain-containing protein n=1 Tax=Nocardioides sp. TRM66260-LWL TaxID=2874478 RepID=UPI001CC78A02|nr:maleylpyruvate isomerase N-terminal domain-containing protein [Nocardioides sp. TRM66260-LWL]MBZ5733887.1 maleylpyruvate isomerase N-terminal domain-containing protein [Nocardioides sp. TRM66260-LWL]
MRPPRESLLTAISRETDRLLEVLAGAPAGARVPSCPDWDADDLLWHLGEVQWFWARILEHRPAGPDALPARVVRPEDRAALLAHLRAASADLRRLLAAADPAEPAWSWATEQTVGFTLRRQAH